MSLTEHASSFFTKRFGVMLLADTPGILTLSGYNYLTTPPTAIPAGLSLPLFAMSAGINSLLLLAVACLVGTYTAPRVELPSYLLEWARTGDDVWRRLRPEVRLAVNLGVIGGIPGLSTNLDDL
jgi:hypothetical protein